MKKNIEKSKNKLFENRLFWGTERQRERERERERERQREFSKTPDGKRAKAEDVKESVLW